MPIAEHDIEQLCNRTPLPAMMRDWAKDPISFTEEAEYILHDTLCNMHPEDALITIALSIFIIDKSHQLPSTQWPVLIELSERTIIHYSEALISRTNDTNSNTAQHTNIEYVAHDLSVISDTLDKLCIDLHSQSYAPIFSIMSALSVQCGSQSEIADFTLDALATDKSGDSTLTPFPEPPKNESDIPFLKMPPVNDN